MKVFELSKLLKMPNKALIKLIDDPRVKSHMSKVPESVVAELLGEEKKTEEAPAEQETAVDTVETAVVAIVPVEECPVTLDELRGGINGLGGKYKHYKWKYLLDA